MADKDDSLIENPDPHFEPLVDLPTIDIRTLEEDEAELVKLRSKLYRFDSEAEPPEWKERGVGDVKILQHKTTGTCRILMRRDKTHKVCCNHYVLPFMELKPNCGSDTKFVWSTPADFADEEARPELLAVRFQNAESAQKYKKAFDDAKVIMADKLDKVAKSKGDADKKTETTVANDKNEKEDKTTDKVAEQLEGLTVKDSGDKKESPDKANTSDSSDNQAER